MAEPKVYMVCKTCGSSDVLCDAYAWWDYELQRWELDQTFDKGAYCSKCDGECRIKETVSKPEDYDDES